MDERSDRGEFYPGGNGRGGVPSDTSTDKVDRVSLGEIGEDYTLKVVKQKVNQIVRAIAPAVACLALCAQAATAPLEDIPNTAPVVTNEEDAVAMAAVGALGGAVSNKVDVEVAGVHARIDSATNALTVQMAELRAADSNRIDATYAKLADIPAQPDLSPYALKSELPQDYLTENDITNFATRAWINSQNYAREGTVYTRLDAQDLAIDAATNWLWAAHLAEAARLNAASNAIARDFRLQIEDLRLGTNALFSNLQSSILNLQSATASGTNRLWLAMASASNRVTAATNATMAAHRADVNALRATDTALSNRLEQARSALDSAWRAGTNTLWQATASGTNRLWQGMASASNRLDSATNKVWQSALRADEALQREIDALRIVAADSNAVTRLVTPDATIYQDATGTVWQVQDSLGPWQATTSSVQFVSWEDLSTEEYDLWKIHFSVDGTNAEGYAASPAGLTSYTLPAGGWEYSELSVYGDFPVTFVRPAIPGGATNAVNRVAYTNDLAAATNGVMGEVNHRFDQWGEMGTVYAATRLVDQTGGGYDDVTAETVARKQDALPYPTNAIPYAAIDGAPGGGAPEWNVKTQDCDFVEFVTNGMAHVRWWNSNTTDISDLGAWPDGAAMMVRFVKQEPVTSWGVVPYIRLVGYGTWPTNNFQSVWWRSGTNIFVNILVEE